MVKNVVKMVGIVVLSAFIVACGKEESKINIGITQIVEHPALDAAREGFVEVIMASEFADKVEFENRSAQGDMSIAQNIAQGFVQDKKDMILAIATPTAQASYNATKEIPILITAVTDPVAAGLVGENISGTSDATPIEKQFELLKSLIPDAKRVGIIYNIGEQNSGIQVENAQNVAGKFGLEVEVVGVSNVNEVSQGLDNLLLKVDVLYTPADNLVASAMPLIVDKANNAGKGIIGAEKAHVEAGALATEGIDYHKLGKQTGEIALEVLRGKKVSDFEIKTLEDTELIINSSSAENLGINIPNEIREKAKVI